MTKKNIDEVMRLTQECLTRYWQLDIDYIINLCDDDVVWIGALQSEFTMGKDAFIEDLTAVKKELKPCHLVSQEYVVAQNAGTACTIAGRYLVTTDETVEYFLQAQQRCTFTWEMVEGDLKIKQLHVSNPIGELKVKKGEKFVNTIGEMAQRYLMNHIHALEDTRQLTVIDEKDVVHFLHNEDIVYAAAEGRNCRIYTVDGSEICGRLNMTEFQQICGKELVPVHRSYVINRNYISLIQRYEVVMLDGSKIPIPVKKYKEIKDCLTEMHGVKTEK